MGITALYTSSNQVLLTPFNSILAFGGTREYKFLKDHYINDRYIYAGDVGDDGPNGIIPESWPPTADVEPMNDTAVTDFYLAGPRLPGLIRTQWGLRPMFKPVTYWYEVSPNMWALSGLGANLPPVSAQIGRIE